MIGGTPDWHKLTEVWCRYGEWDFERYGPAPIHIGTRVPPHVLATFNIVPEEQGPSAGIAINELQVVAATHGIQQAEIENAVEFGLQIARSILRFEEPDVGAVEEPAPELEPEPLKQPEPKSKPLDSNDILRQHGDDAVRIMVDNATTVGGDPAKFDRRKDDARRQPHDVWPDPCPLPTTLLQVASFDFNLLPETLRPWAADVAERMQCPPDYIAVSVMAALGSVLGRKIVIKPKIEDDWQVVSNQWALIVGRPGVLKSPAMEESLKPLKRLCVDADRVFKDAQNTYDVDEKIAKIQAAEALKKASKLLGEKSKSTDASSSEKIENARKLIAENPTSTEPVLRRYIANDTNIASLGVLLQQNPNGLLVFRDEIVSLLSSLDQEERASEKGFYLTGWNGDSSYTFDRIGRGLHLNVECVCLSMLGSTQPGRISDYLSQAVRGGRGDDGLMQRFGLLVWPDISSDWKHVDHWPDKDARTTAFAVFDHLDKLDWHTVGAKRDRGPDGDEEGLPYLRFNIDAYDAFVAWRMDLEKRLRGDLHPALESHLAKYRKLVPGLALIGHLVDGGTGPVAVPALERALGWATYLETHARRAYGSVIAGAAETAKAILAKIKSGHLRGEFSSRDVWRPQWSKLTDRAAVHAGLTMLVDYEYLRETKNATGGRQATIFVVNPKCMKASL
jgi:putative DNA primase/helicase